MSESNGTRKSSSHDYISADSPTSFPRQDDKEVIKIKAQVCDSALE